MRVKLKGLRGVVWFNTLIIAMLFLALSAHAGTVNLPQTGQTTSYAVGDDGTIKAGVAWPSPRFTDNGNQTVTDNLTGLMWTKNAYLPGTYKTWQGALDYVASMNTGAGTYGYTDWRLPNINELESLVNAEQASPATWLNSQGFTNVQSLSYWSSTSHAINTSNAWLVSMGEAGIGAASKSNYDGYVWSVRSGQVGIVSLPRTGQTTTYATGDDGALQKGVAWPSPRFTDNGDQTVTDNLTGLMWTKNAYISAATKTWQQALDYVASMNTGAGTYGYTDWRLPNRKELFSLTDRATFVPSLPSGHPFTNVQYNHYWSSTTFAGEASLARIVSMYDTYAGAFDKSYNNYVWPVRPGQVGTLVNLAISKSGTGSGTVTSSPAGINCGSTCSASFATGTSVTLTATADSGSTFTGWSGDCSGTTSTCTVTMSVAKGVTATFTANTYLLTATKAGTGIFRHIRLQGIPQPHNKDLLVYILYDHRRIVS
ncbi:secreted protein containing DUF1566, partial [Candidatus Magnetobacterium bavaricum]